MTTTVHHDLRLSAGRLRVTVTETADKVFMSITGTKPLGCELRKLSRFLGPICDLYHDDPRPLEIAGQHSDCSATVCGSGAYAFGVIEPVRGAKGAAS